jgi:antitoxin PrlF
MRATVTSKGRITVPKVIRDYLGLRAGGTVQFEQTSSGKVVLRLIKRKTKSTSNLSARHRHRATVRMTTDEIMALTRDG